MKLTLTIVVKYPIKKDFDLALAMIKVPIGLVSWDFSDDRRRVTFELTSRSDYNFLRTRNYLQDLLLMHFGANDRIILYTDMGGITGNDSHNYEGSA